MDLQMEGHRKERRKIGRGQESWRGKKRLCIPMFSPRNWTLVL